MRWLLALSIFLYALPATADTVSGRAYAVDGQTIALVVPGRTIHVRLQGIEVPHTGRDAARAWQTLGRMVLPEVVSCVIPEGSDQDVRAIGTVAGMCRIGQFDLSLSMVHLGAARRAGESR